MKVVASETFEASNGISALLVCILEREFVLIGILVHESGVSFDMDMETKGTSSSQTITHSLHWVVTTYDVPNRDRFTEAF